MQYTLFNNLLKDVLSGKTNVLAAWKEKHINNEFSKTQIDITQRVLNKIIAHSKPNLAQAFALLALMYELGQGSAVNLEKAKALYLKSYNLSSDVEIIYRLAIINYNQGKKIDALNLYQKASALGHVDATYFLALSYFNDFSNSKKSEYFYIALKYYHNAASLGEADAFFDLGQLYHNGMGNLLIANINLAIHFYCQALKGGNKHAAEQLALIYLNGEKNIKPDFNKALYYYLQSHKLGLSITDFNLYLMKQFYIDTILIDKQQILSNKEDKITRIFDLINMRCYQYHADKFSAIKPEYVGNFEKTL